MSTIRYDLASSFSTCPDTSSAPHNIAIEEKTAPLSAPPNTALEEMSAIRDDLASSVSNCPDISSACSATHNIAIESKFYSSRTAPLSAPPNIAIKESDDLASSVSNCPDISSA